MIQHESSEEGFHSIAKVQRHPVSVVSIFISDSDWIQLPVTKVL